MVLGVGPRRLPAVISRCLLMEVSDSLEGYDRRKLSVNGLCKQWRCVWCGAMYDSQWTCIARWLTGSLSPSSRRTSEVFYSPTYPPADLLFMLCGLAIDLWQDQCLGRYSDCPKERQMEESGLAPDSRCTRLITTVSYQHTLICQPHTSYSSASLFFPLQINTLTFLILKLLPSLGFALNHCQLVILHLSVSLYHCLFGFYSFTRGVVAELTLSTFLLRVNKKRE